MNTLHDLARVVQRIHTAKHLLVITGAGISADSGLPTYRGIGGLYNDQHTDEGLPIEVALSGDVMATRPEITWKHLAQIEANCRNAQPNAAHRIIAKLQDIVPTTVLTQNIDGFHRAAGSRDLIEIHGNLFELFCPHCGHQEVHNDYSDLSKFPPPCPKCRGHLRPAVVLFGETLPRAGIRRLEEVLNEGYEVVLSIGTTSVFPYIAQPFMAAHQYGALSIEVNPATTDVSRFADIAWRCSAVTAMQALWTALDR
jgi:NAD-dependent deacetylase